MESTLQVITIMDHDVVVKEINGKRVVTFKDIDELHERPEGTAGRNFRENREHFIEGEDFYTLKPADFQNDDFRRSGISAKDVNNRGTIYITQIGYLMLVKSFADKLAWQVQRQLVNSYFNKQIQPTPITAEVIESVLASMGITTQTVMFWNQRMGTIEGLIERALGQSEKSYTELSNNQRLMAKYLKRIYQYCYPPFQASEWKRQVYNAANRIAAARPSKHKDANAVLSEFYIIMRDRYGFVADQARREYQDKHKSAQRPYTIDLIAEDATLREIFFNIISEEADIAESEVKDQEQSQPLLLEELSPMQQLIKLRGDNSPHGARTYRLIYGRMMSEKQWNYKIGGYKRKHKTKAAPSKMVIIEGSDELRKLFEERVNELLEEVIAQQNKDSTK